MKKCLLLILLLNTFLGYAQKKDFDSRKLSSFGIGAGYKTFFGDNFLAKTYHNKISIVYDFNFRVYKKWGTGIFYRTTRAEPFTNQFVGNSVFARITELGIYVTYYQKITGKWFLAPKIGVSSFVLKNQIKSQFDNESFNYFTSGTNFIIAPEINYFINKDFRVFANTEYGFINMSYVKANTVAVGTKYNGANQLNFALGVKVGF